MRGYLRRSISSFNANKLNGLLAEIALRQRLEAIGFADRVSPGGWIARTKGPGGFATHTVVLFPERILPGHEYHLYRPFPSIPPGLHAIATSFHQAGILAYYCAVDRVVTGSPDQTTWRAQQLGLPTLPDAAPFPDCLLGFDRRSRAYTFLRYSTDSARIPAHAVPEEFAKENLRISFNSRFLAELSDVDGIFFGQQIAYPLEIKEKSAAPDNDMGAYFGLDLGPFAKLAFYAAKRGQVHSLFVVREIDDPEARNEVQWWMIKYERLAQVASWVPRGGGRAMTGGDSTVVRIPKAAFVPFDAEHLSQL